MTATLRNALLIGLLLAPPALLVTQLASAADERPDNKPQEVVVEGTRAYLVKLGKEVLLAESKFYARYNDLNKERQYAVHCYDDPHTGSHFKTDHCQPQYQSDAEAAEAANFLLMFAGSNSTRTAQANPAAPPLPKEMSINAGLPGLRQNMREVVRKSPELQKMLQEHAELWKRYEDTFYKIHGRPLLKAKPPEAATPKPAE